VRLALFVARCQLTSGHVALDDEPLDEWLHRLCGRGVVEKLWKPLLDSKFDGKLEDLPATYIWARTRRMGSTRDKSGREVMGWLDGGYQTIIDALEKKIVALGGVVHAGATVEQIAAEGGRAVGVMVDGRLQRFDHVLCTLAPPMARRVLAPELIEQAPADHCRYLGVICLLLRVKRSVSPYYHLNITDRRVPLTTVVETTHVVDPERVGGHLLYVSKYVDPGHPDHEASPEEVERE
jgi:protoporphyrinogen oxidase